METIVGNKLQSCWAHWRRPGVQMLWCVCANILVIFDGESVHFNGGTVNVAKYILVSVQYIYRVTINYPN